MLRLPPFGRDAPRQRAPRRGPFPVAFLPALPAAAVHCLAAAVRGVILRVGPADGRAVCRCGVDTNADGFLVGRYGACPFLIGGTLLMTLSVATMGLATARWFSNRRTGYRLVKLRRVPAVGDA